jgi:CheY-like chemotaxis protein
MATASLRVLIVDDNMDSARMMKILLAYEGYVVDVAFDGPEAIEAARAFRPDAVLLDLTLPHMSGSEVASKLKGIAELRRCVIVAVTGHDADMVESPSPFEYHFKKPVDHEALMKLLTRLQKSSASSR